MLKSLLKGHLTVLNHISTAESGTTRNSCGAVDQHDVGLVFAKSCMHVGVRFVKVFYYVLARVILNVIED